MTRFWTIRCSVPRRIGFVLMMACATLTGCTTVSVPIPAHVATVLDSPRQLHVIQQQGGGHSIDSLLVVHGEHDGTYWALFDLLGVPRARQILRESQWENDGFLPPNPDARALFAGLIFAWMPPAELADRYGADNVFIQGDTRTLSIQDRVLLTVKETDDGLTLTFESGARWHVSPLKEAK